MAQLIGIDVGGTNLRLGLVETDPAGFAKPQVLEETRFHADFSGLCATHKNAPDEAWQQILQIIANAVNAVKRRFPSVVAVGIGFPGFIDPKTQTILQSPNLPGLNQVDLSTDLSAIIHLPVITENDALAAAYGEYVATRPLRNHLLYLGLGTGVGGGLILHGQPYSGEHGVAMEVGHIITVPNGRLCGCGNHGCMERYASASGVAITYQEATGQQCTAAEIADRATAGDSQALSAYMSAGRALAQALAHMLKVVDVSHVVIGGGMSAAWPLMRASFHQQLDEDLIPTLRGKVQVHISSMGDQAGILGAAMLACQQR